MIWLGSGENNENDSSQDKTILKFQNHKKTLGKHFMSPTISAASKAAAPRKKILAERNENSSTSDTQNPKKSNLDLKKSPKNSSISRSDRSSYRIISSYDHASEPEDDGDTNFLDNSSAKAYDPLTNYLSPRPKYLRFNPNRRREIFNRLERESIEDLNSSFDSQEDDEEESSAEEIGDSSFSPPKESIVEPKIREKTEENDDNMIDDSEEEEEEEEEFEEERGWCLRGVLKLLLTLIACLLSTSYICSMNSPTSSPTQQAIWNLKDGCLMIKKQTLEFISMKMHDAGFFEVEVGDNNSEVDEVEFEEDYYGEIEESVEAEIVEDDVENLDRHEKELVRNENEDSKYKIDKAAEFEAVKAVGLEFKADNFEQLIAARTDEPIDAGSFCLEKEVESSYRGLNDNIVNSIEAAETEIIGGGDVEYETQSSGQLLGANTDESEDADGYVLEMEIEGSNQLQELEHSVKSISEETPKESKGVDDTESLEELIGSHDKLIDSVREVNEIGYHNEVEMEKVGWDTSAVIAISAVSIALTSLAIIHHSKKARSKPAEDSAPVLKPHKLAAEEKVLPSIERKIEFFARPSLSSRSMEEAHRELNQYIRAPTVELIGEIVVGQVNSHSSCTKYKMTKSEESNTTSYGSFTTERKILKKEVN